MESQLMGSDPSGSSTPPGGRARRLRWDGRSDDGLGAEASLGGCSRRDQAALRALNLQAQQTREEPLRSDQSSAASFISTKSAGRPRAWRWFGFAASGF